MTGASTEASGLVGKGTDGVSAGDSDSTGGGGGALIEVRGLSFSRGISPGIAS